MVATSVLFRTLNFPLFPGFLYSYTSSEPLLPPEQESIGFPSKISAERETPLPLLTGCSFSYPPFLGEPCLLIFFGGGLATSFPPPQKTF